MGGCCCYSGWSWKTLCDVSPVSVYVNVCESNSYAEPGQYALRQGFCIHPSIRTEN